MSIRIESSDGSYTLYNEEYQESYHSPKDGALQETLYKHILPPLHYTSLLEQPTIKILDICFGLGFNSFVTLWHYEKISYQGHLQIFSPEKDSALLEKLLSFPYPKELDVLQGYPLSHILHTLLSTHSFGTPSFSLECFIGEAIEYVQSFEKESFDIIYQDAFSPSKNPELWSEEYFTLLFDKLSSNGIITTYSQSSLVKRNAIKAGFLVYELPQTQVRHSRIFSKLPLSSPTLKPKL